MPANQLNIHFNDPSSDEPTTKLKFEVTLATALLRDAAATSPIIAEIISEDIKRVAFHAIQNWKEEHGEAE